MNSTTAKRNWQDIYFTANDGLKLYVRHYQAPQSKRRPLLCLAGLSRNTQDFHKIATQLSGTGDEARDVYCLDARGRGRSQYDPNPQNYTPFNEAFDALDFITLSGTHKPAILGTSRGGILAMLMATIRPGMIGPVILNDIGPEIDTTGLARLKGYIGNTPTPVDWDHAAHIIRTLFREQFSSVQDDQWMDLARQIFLNDIENNPAQSYDPRLAETLVSLDITKPIPDLWPQFEAIRKIPAMLIRGERSDILSEDTALEMTKSHPRIEYLTVENEGHAPLLWDEQTQTAIAGFLARTDHFITQVLSNSSKNRFVAA